MSFSPEQLKKIDELEKFLEQTYEQITDPNQECLDGLKKCFYCNKLQHEEIALFRADAFFCDEDCYDREMWEWVRWQEERDQLNRELNEEGCSRPKLW